MPNGSSGASSVRARVSTASRTVSPARCWTCTRAGVGDGTAVHQWEGAPASSQLWIVEPGNDGPASRSSRTSRASAWTWSAWRPTTVPACRSGLTSTATTSLDHRRSDPQAQGQRQGRRCEGESGSPRRREEGGPGCRGKAPRRRLPRKRLPKRPPRPRKRRRPSRTRPAKKPEVKAGAQTRRQGCRSQAEPAKKPEVKAEPKPARQSPGQEGPREEGFQVRPPFTGCAGPA